MRPATKSTAGETAPATEVFALEDRIDLINLANHQLYLMATTDPLTGLKNRRSFLEALEQELERSTIARRPFSVLVVDADLFKRVNDTHGHHIGDRVLQALSHAFAEETRRLDLVARLGGEEFAILLPDRAAAEARALCARLLERVRAIRIEAGGGQVTCTISIGLTDAGRQGDDVDAVLKRADLALYRAKENGRDRMEAA